MLELGGEVVGVVCQDDELIEESKVSRRSLHNVLCALTTPSVCSIASLNFCAIATTESATSFRHCVVDG